MKAQRPEEPKFEIVPLDLRVITPEPTRVFCSVEIKGERHGEAIPWIECGSANISAIGDNRWRLDARIPRATDCDHSAAVAFRMSLLSLQLKFMVEAVSFFEAYIDLYDGDDFHVPQPGYNPREHPGAIACESCKGVDRHVFVPDGCYVPPFDRELFEKVRGRLVQIQMGPLRRRD